jgi:hypothetical protein
MGGAQTPTIDEMQHWAAYTLVIISSVMLWMRIIGFFISVKFNAVARSCFPMRISRLSHCIMLTTLIGADLYLNYAWSFLHHSAALPPTLTWIVIWACVNILADTLLLVGFLSPSRWPLFWHTSCSAYTLALLFYVIDQISRYDITASIFFAIPPLVIGAFSMGYAPVHLSVPEDTVYLLNAEMRDEKSHRKLSRKRNGNTVIPSTVVSTVSSSHDDTEWIMHVSSPYHDSQNSDDSPI